MSNSKELALELEVVMNKITSQYEYAKSESSRLDKLRNDILHHIENETFNANQGYKFSKALQIVSEKRRIVKDEVETLMGLNAKVSGMRKSIVETTSKTISEFERRDNIRSNGSKSYNPKVLKLTDKNDILNQVVELLSEE